MAQKSKIVIKNNEISDFLTISLDKAPWGSFPFPFNGG
jgi:hypothetical protein